MKRKHVQIALAGGSPTPVYQGITHLHPDQILLVCSEMSKEMAENIRKELHMYRKEDVLIFPISDTDIKAMYQWAETIEQSLPKGITISLNITGGMKMWSVIFSQVFRRRRRSSQIFFIGQDGTYYDFKNKESLEKVNFDMDAQFRILGHEMDSYTPLSEYTNEDFNVLNIVQSLSFSEKTHYFLFCITKLFVEEYKKKYGNCDYNNPFSVTEKLNSLCWNPDTKTFECKLGHRTYSFSSPHVCSIVLNTGWFELYVARMISRTYPAEQIRMNCLFRNKKNTPKNEVDIIVNTGSKLIFVECKTQVFDTTSVDKFRSVVHNYGGLGSKHLFVTNSPMKPEAKEKCDDHGIMTFHFEDPDYSSQQEKVDALASILVELNKKWNFK